MYLSVRYAPILTVNCTRAKQLPKLVPRRRKKFSLKSMDALIVQAVVVLADAAIVVIVVTVVTVVAAAVVGVGAVGGLMDRTTPKPLLMSMTRVPSPLYLDFVDEKKSRSHR
jgi:hypothetical protein